MVRKIIAYKDYYSKFMNSLQESERLWDDIYEFRVTHLGNEFRLFFCYDGDALVILFNGIKKKTQKTPRNEIDKAVRLKKEYYESKGKQIL